MGAVFDWLEHLIERFLGLGASEPIGGLRKVAERMAGEPVKDRSLDSLTASFRLKVVAFLNACAKEGLPLRVLETYRTEARQAWLYASGRTRPGPWLTDRNGVSSKSNHQYGTALDTWPLDLGFGKDDAEKVQAYLARCNTIALRHGLRNLGRKDAGHFELLGA